MPYVLHYRRRAGDLEPLASLLLHPEPAAPGHARRWFRRLTEPLDLTCSLDDCEVMLSELVTNAVVHGGAGSGEAADGWLVRVDWWRVGKALMVDVHSLGEQERVQERASGTDDEHGRGLFLVACLADSWETAVSPFGGTRVSFLMEGALREPEETPVDDER